MREFTEQELLAARDSKEKALHAVEGVEGSGVGLDARGRTAIKIYGNGITPENRNRIQGLFPGYPVAIEEHGEIRKQIG
jgi:hypothetical protein